MSSRIKLPSALLDGLGWDVGEELILEYVEGVFSLKRKLSPSESSDKICPLWTFLM